jgi:hypothetical protein
MEPASRKIMQKIRAPRRLPGRERGTDAHANRGVPLGGVTGREVRLYSADALNQPVQISINKRAR